MRLVLIAAGLFFVMLITIVNNRKRRQFEYECTNQQSRDILSTDDEVLGVKKVVAPMQRTQPVISDIDASIPVPPSFQETPPVAKPKIVTMHLMASPEKPFLGYELLQALQNAGLRFGDMNIFHRHEHEQGLGRILFSVAKANEPGTFDMENMGATACYGLTFFMVPEGSDNDEVSEEIMLHTIYELADDLGGVILDGQRQVLN